MVGLANHTVLIRKDGSERPIDDSAAPIRDEQGGVSGCVLIFRDVTAQRRMERESVSQLLTARLLASIVESSDDAIISKSLDGTIQSWNAAAERLFGYTAAQAVGRHISLVIPAERIAEEDQIIASLRAGQRIEHFETERLRSDGQRILVSLTISPIKDDAGNVVGASKIVRDVTATRKAEERERRLLAQAAEANAKFHAFFEQGAVFAGIMDLNGTILEANRLSWEGCGFTRDQIVGKPFWEGPWWAPSANLVESIKAASTQAATGETFRDGDALLRRRWERAHGGRHHPAHPGRAGPRDLPSPDRGRHHRPQAGRVRPRSIGRQPAPSRERAIRSRPPQGRVPGDAGTRAPKSPGADEQCRAGSPARRAATARQCSRRPRCWSVRSVTWPVWWTICST